MTGRIPLPDGYAAQVADTWQMLLGVGQAARMMRARTTSVSDSIPFTLVAGFLGAGKTTLLNRLLAEPHGIRLAVLVNDFGAINVDAALVRSRSEDAISLANGCACCTLAAGLTATLLGLLEGPDPPQAVILEASGIADPQGIVHAALANPALRMNAVVTLADGENVRQLHADPALAPLIDRQLAAADLAVLNKVDLVDPAERSALRRWVTGRAQRARIVETVQAAVPAGVVLGADVACPPPASGALPDAATPHAALFRSWSVRIDAALDRSRLCTLLDRLPDGILRAKGLLWLADDPGRRSVLQLVGRRWRIDAEGPWTTAPRSELVMIGLANQVNGDAAIRAIAACAAEDLPA